MKRKFELEGILDNGDVDLVRFDSLAEAQREPWSEPYKYRLISEMEVPEHPLVEPLVLNVWHQSEPEAEWALLD